MSDFHFKDVTKPIPGMVVFGPAYWLCKNGDPTQALFWREFPQCNSNAEVTQRYLSEPMYQNIGGLVPTFIEMSFVGPFKSTGQAFPVPA